MKFKMPELTIILIILVGILAFVIGYIIASNKTRRHLESQIPLIRKDAATRSRAVIGGQFSEQLSPFLPDFPFKPTETKFLGKPIDLITFVGSDDKRIDEIAFIEVKSGNSKLSPFEKQVKKAIEEKRVNWYEYKIPEELTKRKE